MRKYYDDNTERLFCLICVEIAGLEPEMKNTLNVPEIVCHVNFRLGLKTPYETARLQELAKKVAEEIALVYNTYYIRYGVGKPAFLMLVSRIDVMG